MRFSLLIVLTISLLSVAFRIHSHDTSNQSRPPSRPAVVPSIQPQSAAPSSAPSQAGSSPAGAPSSVSGGHRGGAHGGSGSGSGSGQPGSPDGQQVLPVTGWDSAVKLGALAFLLIGGGALSMRAGAPRRQGETVQD